MLTRAQRTTAVVAMMPRAVAPTTLSPVPVIKDMMEMDSPAQVKIVKSRNFMPECTFKVVIPGQVKYLKLIVFVFKLYACNHY